MRESITGYAIFNSNKMVRQQGDDRLVLIVESDADISIVDNHVSEFAARLTPGHGKQASLAAARLHREAGDEWVAAFVDKDFEREELLEKTNVFCSRLYDLDAEIYFTCSDLINRFVRAHSVGQKDASIAAVRELVLELGIAIGKVRYVAVTGGINISMARFPVGELTREKHGSGYLIRVLNVAVGRSVLGEEDEAKLREESIDLTFTETEAVGMCNGHDLLGALAVALARVGDLRPRPPELAAAIHGAVDCACFKRLSFYQKITPWAVSVGTEKLCDCA